MLVRNRPTPGTPMAKSASFFSANSFTCRGVMTCSASILRSSGLTGCISSVCSSPFSRMVGGRPTLSSRSEAFRCTIWAMVFLKLNVDPLAAVAVACPASAIGIYPEEDLTELDRLRVIHQHLAHDAGDLGLDLVHDLHRLDDADCLTRRDPGAGLDVGIRARLRGLVERPYHGRLDLLEPGGRPRRFAGLRVAATRCGRRRDRVRGGRGNHGRDAIPGSRDDHLGAEQPLHLDRADLGRVAQELRKAPHVLQLDRLHPRHVLQQVGELLHLLGGHTAVTNPAARRSAQITCPSMREAPEWRRLGMSWMSCYTNSSSSVRPSERSSAPSGPRCTSSS